MLGVNVLEHCVSGERSRVPNVSGKVLNTLYVSTSETDEGSTLIAPTDSVHDKRVRDACGIQCDQDHLLADSDLFRCGTNALSAALR